jgi:hypothetical protein
VASNPFAHHSPPPWLRRRHSHLLPRRALAAVLRAQRDESTGRGGDESGAVIILALVFLVAVSLIVTALLTWVGGSLHATGSFTDERNVEYAATNGVNLAIQNTRYTFDFGTTNPLSTPPNTAMLNNATPELCASYQIPNEAASQVDVYCSMVWQAYSANTRIFTYSACSSASASNATAADCAAKPLLQAVIAFDDYPSGVAVPSPSPTPCVPILQQGNPPSGLDNGSCGSSMAQVSWQWNPVVPAVTSLSPTAGSASGGTTVTIQGTGFTTGETVNFTEQPQELVGSTAYNPAVAAAVVSPQTCGPVSTCLQVTAPAITVGNAYFVTVTTPGGTSQTAANDYTNFVPTFTYTPAPPTVTGLTGAIQGSITGNTLLTIQGTGFWNAPKNAFPAQAFLCPISSTPIASQECTGGVAASVVSVSPPPASSSTFTMTALTPAVSAAGTYYVQVEVFNVYSTQMGTSTQFAYSVQVPLVVSLSPVSGATGTQVMIAGANFVSGSTVGFCPVAKYSFVSFSCTVTTTAATVSASPALTATQMYVTVPAMAAGNYYPIITLPNTPAYNGVPASQPYPQAADTFTHS